MQHGGSLKCVNRYVGGGHLLFKKWFSVKMKTNDVLEKYITVLYVCMI